MKKVIILSFILILLALVLVSAGCVDTDNGKNSQVKGRTYNSENPEYYNEDYCSNDELLIEQYCSPGGLSATTITCEDGCENGACDTSSSEFLERNTLKNFNPEDEVQFTGINGEQWNLKLTGITNEGYYSTIRKACRVELTRAGTSDTYVYTILDKIPSGFWSLTNEFDGLSLLAYGVTEDTCPIMIFDNTIGCKDSDKTYIQTTEDGGINWPPGQDRYTSSSILVKKKYKLPDVCSNRIEYQEGSNTLIRYDPVYSGNYIMEMSCINNKMPSVITESPCENGCENGACLTESAIGDSCEAAGYYCAPSIWACQNAGGFLFPQSTYSCDNHLQSCCTVDVAEMTCREIGGQVCNWNAPCTEATIESTDGPCCLAECEETQGTTKEKVECIFANSNSKQSCYASFNSRGCSGVESCTAEVSGRKGEKIIWKSSCGGYAYTIIDGKNEYAKFDCSQGTEPSYKGWYRNAYWVCFDGTKKEEGGPTSCKSPRVWKNYAEKDCEGKCSDDREKCGINTFGVYNECLGRSILDVLPTCGNGICEPGEGETCVAASIACEQNKECLAKFNKCFYNCVQDCRYQKEIEVSFDEKFKLQISQTATVKGHTFSMKFNDLNIESCDDESIPQPTTAASAVSIQTYDGITGNTVLNSDPIMEFSFIEASPIDSVERITSAEVNELFALYGNIDDLGELHYVEYILPSGCGFENNEPSYGLGGSFVEGSTTKKVFSADTVTHNFAFHSFKCSSEGTYTFKLKLYNSDNEKIDSKTATIKIGEGSPNSQALLCSDSDGGVNPFEKGKCKDSRGTTVEDACVREDGSGPTSEGAYVYEAFCLTDKMIEYCKNYNSAEYCENLPRDCYAGGLIPDPNLAWSYFPYNKKYFCPNGCKDGVCLGEEGTTPEHPSCDKEPYAVLQVKYAMLPEKKLYTEVIKLQVGEKKQVGNVIISFLDFDTGLKSGLFYLTQNDPDFNCPENCKCDINNNKIKCWDIEECPEGTLLCQDGSCQEKCDIIGGDKQCTFGCTYNENCLPIGTRSDNFYCSVEGGMKSQKPAGESCKNNFECTSNLCISDQCIDEGLFKRIVIWFKKLFGTE